MSLIINDNILYYKCQEKTGELMLKIKDICVGDLIHVPLNGNHILIMHKDDERQELGCRLAKCDITIDIDYETAIEMIEHGKWRKV